MIEGKPSGLKGQPLKKRSVVLLPHSAHHSGRKYLVALRSLSLLLPSSLTAKLAGKVVGVTDGDTITVLVEQRSV